MVTPPSRYKLARSPPAHTRAEVAGLPQWALPQRAAVTMTAPSDRLQLLLALDLGPHDLANLPAESGDVRDKRWIRISASRVAVAKADVITGAGGGQDQLTRGLAACSRPVHSTCRLRGTGSIRLSRVQRNRILNGVFRAEGAHNWTTRTPPSGTGPPLQHPRRRRQPRRGR